MQDALHRVLLKTKEQILHILNVLYLLLGSPNVLSLADVPPKQLISFPDVLRQTFQGLVPQFLRHPVKGFGNAAGDAGKGVAVFSFTPDAASGNQLRFVLSTLRRWTRSRVLPASGRLSR